MTAPAAVTDDAGIRHSSKRRPKSKTPAPPRPTCSPSHSSNSSSARGDSPSSNATDSTFPSLAASHTSRPSRPARRPPPRRPLSSPSPSPRSPTAAVRGSTSAAGRLFRQQARLLEQMVDVDEEEEVAEAEERRHQKAQARARQRRQRADDSDELSEQSDGEDGEGIEQRWKVERKQQRSKRGGRSQRTENGAADRPARVNKPHATAPASAPTVSYPYLHPPEFRKRKRRKKDAAQQVKLRLLPIRERDCAPLEDDLIASSSDEREQKDGGDQQNGGRAQLMEAATDEFDSVCCTPARYGRPRQSAPTASGGGTLIAIGPSVTNKPLSAPPLSPVFDDSDPDEHQPTVAPPASSTSTSLQHVSQPVLQQQHTPALHHTDETRPQHTVATTQARRGQTAQPTDIAAQPRQQQKQESEDEIEQDTIKREPPDDASTDHLKTTAAPPRPNAVSSDRARLRIIVARARALQPDVSVPLSSLFRLPLVAALCPTGTHSALKQRRQQQHVVSAHCQLHAPKPIAPPSVMLDREAE